MKITKKTLRKIIEQEMAAVNKQLKDADDIMKRVKEIADKKGIKSYSYVNGKIGGVQLTKDEIRYILKGGEKPGESFVDGRKVYSSRSKQLYNKAIKQKEKSLKIRMASLAFSLTIFSLLHPAEEAPMTMIKKLKTQIKNWLSHNSSTIEKTTIQKVLNQIDNAVKNGVAIHEDEAIAKLLGFKTFQSTRKLIDKVMSKKKQ
tara:strand:- start:217 stop:822 length:606 start_codon:yes stop_codon:yes gene_type:complete